jgi:hypothetical protein
MNIKKFLSTPKGQLIGSLCALGAVWLVLLLYFGGEFLGNLPSADNLDDSRRELKRQQKLLEKAKAGDLQQTVTLEEVVDAPVAKGSQLGILTVTSGEEVVAEIPLRRHLFAPRRHKDLLRPGTVLFQTPHALRAEVLLIFLQRERQCREQRNAELF